MERPITKELSAQTVVLFDNSCETDPAVLWSGPPSGSSVGVIVWNIASVPVILRYSRIMMSPGKIGRQTMFSLSVLQT
ncbi:hypothetical protein DdX_15662 [Ditylenchus destructor]|uniref:Uncharacterized protein n=1 Tax=Ditylenchus destructor TaxID=166010 RepID=A0AAD4QUJ2_9BILA|nr:hypothetical protein DdX_15662 [Ditylenchus destructor]